MGRITEDGLLKVHIVRYPEGWLVELNGELDLANAGTLETELHQLTGDAPILIDLGGLDFIDSTGIAVLVRARSARPGLHAFETRNARGQVERVLGLCGLQARTDSSLTPLVEATPIQRG